MSKTQNLDDINRRIEQLRHQRQALLAREREKERKQRTRRLIERGALLEKYCEVAEWTTPQVETLLSYVISLPEVKTYLTTHGLEMKGSEAEKEGTDGV